MLELVSSFVAWLKQLLGSDANEIVQILGGVLTLAIAIATVFRNVGKSAWQTIRGLWRTLFGKKAVDSDRDNRAISEITVYPIATLEELKAVWNFDEKAYGDDENITFELFQQWWTSYPGLYAAYREDKPVGVFGIFPVTEEWAERLVRREVFEKDLDAEIIRRSRRRHWYISGISVSRRTKGLSRLPFKLICQSAQRWYQKHKELIEAGPVHIVSVGTTLDGQRLLHEMLHFDVVNPEVNANEHPIFARDVSEKQLRTFLTVSPLCKGCCDPMLLANMPS